MTLDSSARVALGLLGEQGWCKDGQGHKEQGRKNFEVFKLLIKKAAPLKESAVEISVFQSF